MVLYSRWGMAGLWATCSSCGFYDSMIITGKMGCKSYLLGRGVTDQVIKKSLFTTGESLMIICTGTVVGLESHCWFLAEQHGDIIYLPGECWWWFTNQLAPVDYFVVLWPPPRTEHSTEAVDSAGHKHFPSPAEPWFWCKGFRLVLGFTFEGVKLILAWLDLLWQVRTVKKVLCVGKKNRKEKTWSKMLQFFTLLQCISNSSCTGNAAA